MLLPIEQAAALFARGDRRLDLNPCAGRGCGGRSGAFLRRGIDPAVATVTTWREANRALLFVLRLEKGLVFSAVALIVAVASFALLAALVDGAVEQALGGSAVAGGDGRAAGPVAAGVPPARRPAVGRRRRPRRRCRRGARDVNSTATGSFRRPSDVYVVDYVPFLVRGTDVLVVLVVTVLFTAAAAAVGARRASHLDPVEAMRSARA